MSDGDCLLSEMEGEDAVDDQSLDPDQLWSNNIISWIPLMFCGYDFAWDLWYPDMLYFRSGKLASFGMLQFEQ